VEAFVAYEVTSLKLAYMVHDELEEVKRIAQQAGTILLRYFRSHTRVEWKSPGDPVTIADREASEFIVGELSRLFPKDGILSEELPDTTARLSHSRVWMIDPMDGTRDFIAGGDDFAVMIGLVEAGRPTLGVVYQPTTDRLYYATRGSGAFLDAGGPVNSLHVSKESTAAKMTMAMSRTHRSSRVHRIAEQLRIPNEIRMGSVGLKVGIICEGQAHLYIHVGNKTQIWDTCAPEAILVEAGGQMTDISGLPLQYDRAEVKNPNGVIASNGAVHERAVKATQSIVSLG
jgi:3'(2'), 5'-bisphosphate nucleotidase